VSYVTHANADLTPKTRKKTHPAGHRAGLDSTPGRRAVPVLTGHREEVGGPVPGLW
jgi:hypothetical protein